MNIITPTMYFERTIPVSFAGCKSSSPLRLVVWDNVVRDEHIVNLYSKGSESIPYVDRDNRYSTLIPQWRFIDADTNEFVHHITVPTTKILNDAGTKVIGTSGVKEFYYVDDTATNSDGVLLYATLSSHPFTSDIDPQYIQDINLPGYANSKLNAVQTYHVNSVPPGHLKITRDGARDLRPYYWNTTKIPYTVTLGTNLDLCNNCDPNVFQSTRYITHSDVASYESNFADCGTETDPQLNWDGGAGYPTITEGPGGYHPNEIDTAACGLKSSSDNATRFKNLTKSRTTITANEPFYIEFEWFASGSYGYPDDGRFGCHPFIGFYIMDQTEFDSDWNDQFTGNVVCLTDSGLPPSNFTKHSTLGGTSYELKEADYYNGIVDTEIPPIIYTVPDNNNNPQWGYHPRDAYGEINAATVKAYFPQGVPFNGFFVMRVSEMCANRLFCTIRDFKIHPISVTTPLTGQYHIEIDNINSNLSYVDNRFKDFDDNNLPTSAVVRGTLQPVVTGSSLTMYASTLYNTNDLKLSYYNPFIWVSNPKNKTLNQIFYDNSRLRDKFLNQTEEHSSTSIGLTEDYNIIQVPYVSSYPQEILSPDNTLTYLSGFGGIYGIAIDSCYNIWTADAELDAIYKYDTVGNLLTSISLPFGSTPAGITVDRSNNVFVTLTDSVSTNKYSTLGEYITCLLPDNFETHASIGENEIYSPAQVEVDIYDNVWVSYTNPNSSCIIKYNKNYQQESVITFDPNIAPVDMLLDQYHNLHVISQFDSDNLQYPERHENGHYNAYNSAGTLLSSASGLNNPHYITIDINNNIWITEGVSMVSVLDGPGLSAVPIENSENSFSQYYVTSNTLSPVATRNTNYVEAAGQTDNPSSRSIHGDIQIQGLGATTDGKLWVIQSKLNKAIEADCVTKQFVRSIPIYPKDQIEIYNRSIDKTHITSPDDDWYRSAQAYGDWTGIRWATKYVFSASNATLELTGRSTEFDVLDSPDELRLINDSYNMSNAMSNLFLANHMTRDNFPVFHEDYLGNVIGTNQSDYSTIGRQTHEKIANFVSNHVDIDTCNIDQLYSICESIDVPIDQYITDLPAELKRTMDIASIHFNNLRGDKNRYNLNFGPGLCDSLGRYTTANDTEFTINRHINELTVTDIVSSGEGIVVFDQTTGQYDVLYIDLPSSVTTIQMSELSGYGLRYPISTGNSFNKYTFFKYIKDNHISSVTNNRIDWDNSLNTVLFETSSVNDWYGEYGIIEKLIDYNFHKGLGFILSGVE